MQKNKLRYPSEKINAVSHIRVTRGGDGSGNIWKLHGWSNYKYMHVCSGDQMGRLSPTLVFDVLFGNWEKFCSI